MWIILLLYVCPGLHTQFGHIVVTLIPSYNIAGVDRHAGISPGDDGWSVAITQSTNNRSRCPYKQSPRWSFAILFLYDNDGGDCLPPPANAMQGHGQELDLCVDGWILERINE